MKHYKSISAKILNKDDINRVEVKFSGDGAYTPDEFTSLFMAILDSYTEALLQTNERKQVYEYWNNVLGTFLGRIIPANEIYETSEDHKKLKEVVDKTLKTKPTKKNEKKTTENRLAAMVLAKELMLEAGLTEETVDMMLSKKITKDDLDVVKEK
jgi:hypothetical protein